MIDEARLEKLLDKVELFLDRQNRLLERLEPFFVKWAETVEEMLEEEKHLFDRSVEEEELAE